MKKIIFLCTLQIPLKMTSARLGVGLGFTSPCGQPDALLTQPQTLCDPCSAEIAQVRREFQSAARPRSAAAWRGAAPHHIIMDVVMPRPLSASSQGHYRMTWRARLGRSCGASLPSLIARAESLLQPHVVERARRLARNQMEESMHLAQTAHTDVLASAVEEGLLTVTECRLARGPRVEAVTRRHLLLELGQALACFGHPGSACELLRAATDCFVSGAVVGTAVAVQAPSGGTGRATFLRECFTQLAVAAALRDGQGTAVTAAAAQAVQRLAVARGVWLHPLQRPVTAYVQGLRARPVWPTSEVPAAMALEAAAGAILAECRALAGQHFRRCARHCQRWMCRNLLGLTQP